MARLIKGKVTDVDAYLAAMPKEVRTTLEKIRAMIRSTAPDAEECISYQIPAYKKNGMLVGFGATSDHCSFFVMSPALMKKMSQDLSSYKTSTGAIQFAHGRPLPKTLVAKIVKARLKENLEKQGKSSDRRKATKAKAEDVETFLIKKKHPLNKEVNAVRKIIKSVDSRIEERIKWNAPSYHIDGKDFLTFNLWEKNRVHLVFHHPKIVTVKSTILEGNYDTRRMTYFDDSKDVSSKTAALKKVIKTLIKTVAKK